MRYPVHVDDWVCVCEGKVGGYTHCVLPRILLTQVCVWLSITANVTLQIWPRLAFVQYLALLQPMRLCLLLLLAAVAAKVWRRRAWQMSQYRCWVVHYTEKAVNCRGFQLNQETQPSWFSSVTSQCQNTVSHNGQASVDKTMGLGKGETWQIVDNYTSLSLTTLANANHWSC